MKTRLFKEQGPGAGLIGRLLRLRFWIAEALHLGEQQTILVVAALIGLLGALAAHAFRVASEFIHWALTGQHTGHVESFARLAWWQCLLVPAAGGLCAGVILSLRSKWRSPKAGDYMEAIVLGDGRVSFRSSLIQSASALFSISSGASIGREGPLVQLSAMLASLFGLGKNTPAVRLRLYVACGAAAGIASVYNAPIAGALFVSEIILQSIAMETFGPLVLASMTATLTSRHLTGNNPLYSVALPQFSEIGWSELGAYAALGLIAGVAAPMFLRILRLTRTGFQKTRIPLPLRLALGGALVGALAILHPEVGGNGYSVIVSILRGNWMVQTLLFILLFKVAATAISFGSGAVGGVFTPTLFVGVSLGSVFALGLQALWPTFAAYPAAYGLVGMGALLSATTQAPLMAIILAFELSLNYDIILPLMAACVLAYYTAKTFSIRGVYASATESTANLSYERGLASGHVAQLMKPNPPHVTLVSPFSEIVRIFVAQRFNSLYVLDSRKRFCGAVSMHDVKEFLHAPDLSETIIASDLVRNDFPTIRPDASFAQALESFSHHTGERLPVVSNDEHHQLLGSISKADLMLALVNIRQRRSDPPPQPAA